VGDRDKDGVLDPDDICPDEHKGNRPDPDRLGCPIGDRDKDGVLDPDDLCPDEHKGNTPDPKRLGCPAGDRDKDGVLDFEDVCPDEHQGQYPDAARKGCPAPDRDKDTVVDPVDACPDKPGAPNPDPKKNGCPGLVEVKGGQIVIVKPVFFATNKDVILAKSFPVLQAVADALKAFPHIKKVRVEGHTDDRGKVDYNIDLSDRRAKSVMKWLTEHGIEAGRLEAQGFGPKKPVADNKTEPGRAKNRRVDFVITDPPQPAGVQVQDAKAAEVPDSPDQSDGKKGGKGKKGAAPAKGEQPAKPAAKPAAKGAKGATGKK
jgi:outer membrane protein OmpA-like peptidoglycan-associated protein